MPFQNLNQIRKKDEISKIAGELEKIINMPELEDIFDKVMIGHQMFGEDSGFFCDGYFLILSSSGLKERNERVIVAPKEYGGGLFIEEKNIITKEDFEYIIKKYDITLQDAQNLYSKLKN